MKSPEKDAWQDFLQNILRAKKELDEEKTEFCEIWYRGLSRSDHRLLPSLFRNYLEPNEDDTWTHIWEGEQDLYFEFASRARELHGVVDDDWDILCTMQHYGVPTRLLDWTETLAVGVYFALHGFSKGPGIPTVFDPKAPPCVWLLNPYELNVYSAGGARDLFDPKNLGWDEGEKAYYGYSELFFEGGMCWDDPIAIYPRQRTTRMQVQRGWFTIHGDNFVDMTMLEHQDKFLRRVDIPLAAEAAAREYLISAGIELFTLFPDLSNLAVHLAREYAGECSKWQSKG